MTLIVPRLTWEYGHEIIALPAIWNDPPASLWLNCVEPTEKGILKLLTQAEPVLLLLQILGFELKVLRVATREEDRMVQVNFCTMHARLTGFSFADAHPELDWPDDSSHCVVFQAGRPYHPYPSAELLESWGDGRVRLDEEGAVDDLFVVLGFDSVNETEPVGDAILARSTDFAHDAIERCFPDGIDHCGIFEPGNHLVDFHVDETTSEVFDRQAVFAEIGEGLRSFICSSGQSLRDFMVTELDPMECDSDTGNHRPDALATVLSESLIEEQSERSIARSYAGVLPRGDSYMPRDYLAQARTLSPIAMLADAGDRGILHFWGAGGDEAPGLGLYQEMRSSTASRIRYELIEMAGLWTVTPSLAEAAFYRAKTVFEAGYQDVLDELPGEREKGTLTSAMFAFDDIEANFSDLTKFELHEPLLRVGWGLVICDSFWAEEERDKDFIEAFAKGFELGLGDTAVAEMLAFQERYDEYIYAAPFLQPVFQVGVVWGAAEAAKDWIEDIGDLLSDPEQALDDAMEALQAVLDMPLVDVAEKFGVATGQAALAKLEDLSSQPNVFMFTIELGKTFGPLLLEAILSITLEPIAAAALLSAARLALRTLDEVIDGVATVATAMARHRFELDTSIESLAARVDPVGDHPVEGLPPATKAAIDSELPVVTWPAHVRNLADLLHGPHAAEAVEGILVIEEALTDGVLNGELFGKVLRDICRGKRTNHYLACLGKASNAGVNRHNLVKALRTANPDEFEEQMILAIARQFETTEDLYSGIKGVGMNSSMVKRIQRRWNSDIAESDRVDLARIIRDKKLTAWDSSEFSPTPHPDSPDGEVWPGIFEGWLKRTKSSRDSGEHANARQRGESVDTRVQWHACHLIARKFGGPSIAAENLIPCTQRVNTSPMASSESYIAKLLDTHGEVYVRVSVEGHDHWGVPQKVRYEVYKRDGDRLPELIHVDPIELHYSVYPGRSPYGWDATQGDLLKGNRTGVRQVEGEH